MEGLCLNARTAECAQKFFSLLELHTMTPLHQRLLLAPRRQESATRTVH